MEEWSKLKSTQKTVAFTIVITFIILVYQNIAIAAEPQVSAGWRSTAGLKSDGTVVAVGLNIYGQCDVSNWTGIQQVAAGLLHTASLESDGTVVAVGSTDGGQCDVSNWTGIQQVAAGCYQTVGLESEGTVVAVGWNDDGQCDVSNWTSIQQVAAGCYHTVGLQSEGTVVAVGWDDDGQCDVNSWTDIQQVTAGIYHTVGLQSDGTVVAVGDNNNGRCDVGSWTGIQQVAAGCHHTVGLKSDGTVVAVGSTDYGQCDVSGWTDIQQVTAGCHHTVGLKSDGTVVAAGSNDDGQCDVIDWDLGRLTTTIINISNVEGGAAELEGIWRVDLYDAAGEPVKQYHSSSTSIEMRLPLGGYTSEVYFLYDDGQGIWEFWGEKEFSVTTSGTSVAFTRNLPWLATIGPIEQVLASGDILSVACTVKNELSSSVKVVLEGQIGNGNVMRSNALNIPAASSGDVTFQITDLPDSGVWPLRYWVKAIPLGESAFKITDHSVIDGYLSYESNGLQESEYICMDYIDKDGKLWQIGFDIKMSTADWFSDPQNTFKNIKYYKNGSNVSPSEAELQMLLNRVAQYFARYYPYIQIGEEFDTDYGIWRQPCGISWACRLALIDFDPYERKVIYKDLIWDAITGRNYPFLNTEYRVPDDSAYFASSLPLKISSYIDELWGRYSSSISEEVSQLNRIKKILHIAEISENDTTLFDEIKTASKSLGKCVSMLKDVNKVGMHTIQKIVLMDFLASIGYAENRIDTLKEAYYFVKNHIESRVDPVLEQAILEIENELEDNMNSLGNTIVSSFLEVTLGDLMDPNYVKQRIITMAAHSKLAQKFVGTVAKNFKLSNTAVASAVIEGIKGLTTVMDTGDEWRRIILSGMLSRAVIEYAQNDPTWRAAAFPTNDVMTSQDMEKYQIRDVYDLQSIFACEHLNRGLMLIDSSWDSVFQDAIDSTLQQATSPPYMYPINYASTAVLFGKQVGTAAAELVYSDDLEAVRDMFKSIIDAAEKKNQTINEWAEMMADSQRKAMPWIPLLLLDD